MSEKKLGCPRHGSPVIQLKADNSAEIKTMIAVAAIGLSRAISHGAISAEFACYRFFTPALMTILRRAGIDDTLIETVNLGTDLEYVERLIPHSLKESATEIEKRSLQHIVEANHERHAEQWLRIYCYAESITDETNAQKADPVGGHEDQAVVRIGAEGREEVLILLDTMALGARHAVVNHVLPIDFFANRLFPHPGFFRFLSSMDAPKNLQKALSWILSPEDTDQAALSRSSFSATACEMELLNILKNNLPSRNPPDQWFFMPLGRDMSQKQLYYAPKNVGC